MNDNFQKKSIGDDIVSDNTNINNIGGNENVEKDLFNSKEGSQKDQEVILEEGKDTFKEEEKVDLEEKADPQESKGAQKEVQEAPQDLSGDTVDIPYTRPTTYSTTYYSADSLKNEKKDKPQKSFSGGFVIAVASVCVVLSLLFGALSGVAASYIFGKNGGNAKDPLDEGGAPVTSNNGDNVITVNKNNAPTKVEQTIDNKEEETMSTVEVVEAVADSVVEVSTLTTSNYGQYVSGGAGSGVIIAQGNGYAYIVTNYHVVGDSDYIAVRLTDKSEYEAEYIDGDEYNDIAVIRIEETKELCVAKIGSSDTLRVGEGVVAIGNPLGELGGTVTNGIVSALDREINIGGVTMTLLQTNAAVNPGNSGGGLFNMAGRLVGIVNAKHQESGIEGLGFAIPIDKVYGDLIEIIEDGYIHGRVSVGIEAMYLDRISAAYYFRTSKEGVYVISSDNEELKVGDRIIEIDSIAIKSETDYVSTVRSLEIGSEIIIKVARGNQTYDVTVVVKEYIPSGLKIA